MKPKLYLFIGYPGAGKTTVSKIIEKKTGAVHLWADVERHKLFNNPTHSLAESHKLYKQLNDRAKKLLKSGKSVIFDTSFNYEKDRLHLKQIADEANAKTIIIWVNTPVNIAKKRAVNTAMNRNFYESAMNEKDFDRIVTHLEVPKNIGPIIKIDGTNTTESEVLALLKDHI